MSMMFISLNITKNNPVVKVADFVKVLSKTHFEEHLQRFLQKGGKGLLLKKPNSLYMEHDSYFEHLVRCVTFFTIV